jgi:hypothetical protein
MLHHIEDCADFELSGKKNRSAQKSKILSPFARRTTHAANI